MVWIAVWGALLGVAPAQAHLIAAQKGTLNFVDQGAFLVLSVPVSALQQVDDNGDGALSKAEFTVHAQAIGAQIKAGVTLRDTKGTLPLQLMMVDISPNESAPEAPVQHVVVLGRFELSAAPSELFMHFSLFGKDSKEQQLDMTITQQANKQWLRFSLGHETQAVLPSTLAVLGQTIRAGAAHVLGGADHLLFLLVVLSAAWRWRELLGVLTCFTLGHAFTLAVCVWGGWSVPERIVEPAIAATIVGMAAFDMWSRCDMRPVRPGVRLALVFLCALVHGLGLAGALRELTQWAPGSAQLIAAIAGFNVGIELAQIVVAAFVGVMVWGLYQLVPSVNRQGVAQFGSLAGVVAGTFWLIQRVF